MTVERLSNYLKVHKIVNRLNNRLLDTVEYIPIDVNIHMDGLDTMGRYLFYYIYSHLFYTYLYLLPLLLLMSRLLLSSLLLLLLLLLLLMMMFLRFVAAFVAAFVAPLDCC